LGTTKARLPVVVDKEGPRRKIIMPINGELVKGLSTDRDACHKYRRTRKSNRKKLKFLREAPTQRGGAAYSKDQVRGVWVGILSYGRCSSEKM